MNHKAWLHLIFLEWGIITSSNHILMRAILDKFSNMTRAIYPKKSPNQKSDYWLITSNQLCIEINTFWQRAITDHRAGNYKTAGNYKMTLSTVKCGLQSVAWFRLKKLRNNQKEKQASGSIYSKLKACTLPSLFWLCVCFFFLNSLL